MIPFTVKQTPPKDGYKLERWNQVGYRATAIAYLQREGLDTIETWDGQWYTLAELLAARLGNKTPNT